MLLDNYQNNFMVFLPPIGFGFFLVISYIIQPIIVGALNVIILSRLYNTEGFQTSFWLNGLFLLLTFSTINLLIQTVWSVPFSLPLAIIEIITLSAPFGYLEVQQPRLEETSIQPTTNSQCCGPRTQQQLYPVTV